MNCCLALVTQLAATGRICALTDNICLMTNLDSCYHDGYKLTPANGKQIAVDGFWSSPI